MSIFRSILREWRIVENEDNYENAVAQVPRPPGWRSNEADVDPTPGDYEDWALEHTAKTPKGSLVVGSLHVDPNDQQAPHAQYYWQHQLPTVLRHAQKAVASGKNIVYVSEGRSGEEAPADMGHMAQELNKRFPGKIHHDTFDDQAVDAHDRTSPIWNKLYHAAKWNRPLAHAAMTAFMASQGDDPNDLRSAGVLTPEARELLQQKYQIDPLNPEHAANMQAAVLPKSTGQNHNELSHLGEVYNAARQRNLLKKVRNAENAGHVAIVGAGGPHAYSLKKTLESGDHHVL